MSSSWISPRWIVAFFSVAWSIIGIYYYIHKLSLDDSWMVKIDKSVATLNTSQNLVWSTPFLQVPSKLAQFVIPDPLLHSINEWWLSQCDIWTYRSGHTRKDIAINWASSIYFEKNIGWADSNFQNFYGPKNEKEAINTHGELQPWLNLILQNNCDRYPISPYTNISLWGMQLSFTEGYYLSYRWSGDESIRSESFHQNYPFAINSYLNMEWSCDIYARVWISPNVAPRVLSAHCSQYKSMSTRSGLVQSKWRVSFLIPNTSSYVTLEQLDNSTDLQLTYGSLSKTIHIPGSVISNIPSSDFYMNTTATEFHNITTTVMNRIDIPRRASTTGIEVVFGQDKKWYFNIEPDTWEVSEIKYDFN